MSRLSLSEAEELADCLGGPSEINGLTVEVTIFDGDIGSVWDDVEAFIATLHRDIDRSSIEVIADRIEGMDVACTSITIKAGEARGGAPSSDPLG